MTYRFFGREKWKAGWGRSVCAVMAGCLPLLVFCQSTPQKQVTRQSQVWLSLNTVARLSPRWGILADLHIRRNNFLADPSFYLVRAAANYWIKESMTAAAGYGHLWSAQSDGKGGFVFANENRIYQQFQAGSKKGRVSLLQRLRNEQRWQQKTVNGEKTNDYRFTDRIRYLFSFTYDVFQKKNLPSAVLADEIMFHFGKEVVYNVFDQNRIFLGIRQVINSRLNFDFGYMMVYVQKYSGYQYDLNHTLRLFFYWNIGKRYTNQQATMEKVMDED